jgi:hypothetical protein
VQTQLTLDLYLEYLRAAFHTCYYCALVCDHAEELQRKCIAHERKPLSKQLLEELRAQQEAAAAAEAEAVKAEEEGGAPKVEGEDKPAAPVKEKPNENREWKRNGSRRRYMQAFRWLTPYADERWLEWHDSKIALLINRDNVNPADYGGKNYDE